MLLKNVLRSPIDYSDYGDEDDPLADMSATPPGQGRDEQEP